MIDMNKVDSNILYLVKRSAFNRFCKVCGNSFAKTKNGNYTFGKGFSHLYNFHLALIMTR